MANGILVIDKSAGWTSQDVAAKLRGVFHERRVGHAGGCAGYAPALPRPDRADPAHVFRH